MCFSKIRRSFIAPVLQWVCCATLNTPHNACHSIRVEGSYTSTTAGIVEKSSVSHQSICYGWKEDNERVERPFCVLSVTREPSVPVDIVTLDARNISAAVRRDTCLATCLSGRDCLFLVCHRPPSVHAPRNIVFLKIRLKSTLRDAKTTSQHSKTGEVSGMRASPMVRGRGG